MFVLHVHKYQCAWEGPSRCLVSTIIIFYVIVFAKGLSLDLAVRD